MKCLAGGTILLLLSWSLRLEFQIPLSVFPYLISVGAFSIGFSILFFLFSLREIGAMKTRPLYNFEPKCRPGLIHGNHILDFVEDILRTKGYNFDRALLKRALAKPHRTGWIHGDAEEGIPRTEHRNKR